MKKQKNIFCLNDVPHENIKIPQALLNIEKKERSNPFAWRGQFTPQFVQILLQTYASEDSTIIDPFAGSGTVLYEAGRENLKAFGAEINPSACLIASIYRFMNMEPSRRCHCIAEVDKVLKK